MQALESDDRYRRDAWVHWDDGGGFLDGWTDTLSIADLRLRSVALSAVVAMFVTLLVPFFAQAAWAATPQELTDIACPSDEVQSAGFDDTDGTFFELEIDCIVAYAVAQGFGDGGYHPGALISRGQMATMIANLLRYAGLSPDNPPDAFDDDDGTAHEANINWLADLGIVRGFTDGTYRPAAPVSREQMATYIDGAYTAITGNELPTGADRFRDDEQSAHEDAINAIANAGIAEGVGNNRYDTASSVTRQQMAGFLSRLIGLLLSEGEVPVKYAPNLTGLTWIDTNANNVFDEGDQIQLAFDEAMTANSAIKICDADGDYTWLDTDATAGVADGRTRSSLSGSGTDTLTFTVGEALDVAGDGDGSLDGTLTVCGAEGIVDGEGNPWDPTGDPASTRQFTPEPAGPPAGGGGGGAAPPARATMPSLVSWSSPVNIANQTAAKVSGTGEHGSTVFLEISDRLTGTVVTHTGVVAGNWDFRGLVLTGLADGTVTYSVYAVGPGARPASGLDVRTAIKDTVAPLTPTITEAPDPVNIANHDAVAVTGTAGADTQAVRVWVTDGFDTLMLTDTTFVGGSYGVVFNLSGSAISDGIITYSALAFDDVGNRSGVAGPVTATKDTVAPPAPVLDHFDDPVNVLNHQAVLVSGTVGADTYQVTLTVSDGGGASVVTGFATTPGDSFQLLLDLTPLADGIVTVSAVAFDDVANPSGPSNVLTATKDTVRPTFAADAVGGTFQIVITASEALAPGTVDTVGPVFDDFTEDSVRAIVGVTLTAGDTLLTVGFSGRIASGEVLTLLAGAVTDIHGNPNVTFTTRAMPAPPIITEVDAPITQGNQAMVAVTGTHQENGASIRVVATDGGTSVTGNATAAAGLWNLSLDLSTLLDGDVTFTAWASNNGFTSTASEPVTATKDTVGPTGEITGYAKYVNADNGSSFDFAIPIVTGGPASSIVITITDDQDDTLVLGTGADTAIGYGAGSPDLIGFGIGPTGTITITAQMTDTYGNLGPVDVVTLPIDTIVPLSPTVAGISDPITSGNVAQVEVSGTAEAGSRVTVTVTDGVTEVAAAATADGAGNWQINGLDVSSLADGVVSATATATDAAGNTSEDSLTVTAFKDAVSQLTITTPDPVSMGNAAAYRIRGTAEPGSTIDIAISDGVGSPIVTGTIADAFADWGVVTDVSGLLDGTLTVTVSATDLFGNVTTVSYNVPKDTLAPAPPKISSATDPIISLNHESVTATGQSGEAGLTILVLYEDQFGALVTATTTGNGVGDWSVAGVSVTVLADGTITVTAVAFDAVGNASGLGAPITVFKETTVPAFTVTGTAGFGHSSVTFTASEALVSATVDENSVGGFDDFTETAAADIIGVEFIAPDVIVVYFNGDLSSGEKIGLVDAAVTDPYGNPNDPLTYTIP